MASTPQTQAVLTIGGDSSGAKQAIADAKSGLTSLGAAAKQSGQSMTTSFVKGALVVEGIKLGIRGVVSGTRSLISFTKQSIGLRQKEVQGIRELDRSLRTVNSTYAAQEKRIESIARTIQAKTNFDDAAVRQTFAELVVGLGDVEKAYLALPVAIDLAARGIGGQALIRAFRGQGRGLMGLGIAEDIFKGGDFNKILAAISARSVGTAEAAADPWIQMGNAVENVKESFGALVQEPVEAWLKKIAAAINEVNDTGFFDKEKILGNLKTVLSASVELIEIWTPVIAKAIKVGITKTLGVGWDDLTKIAALGVLGGRVGGVPGAVAGVATGIATQKYATELGEKYPGSESDGKGGAGVGWGEGVSIAGGGREDFSKPSAAHPIKYLQWKKRMKAAEKTFPQEQGELTDFFGWAKQGGLKYAFKRQLMRNLGLESPKSVTEESLDSDFSKASAKTDALMKRVRGEIGMADIIDPELQKRYPEYRREAASSDTWRNFMPYVSQYPPWEREWRAKAAEGAEDARQAAWSAGMRNRTYIPMIDQETPDQSDRWMRNEAARKSRRLANQSADAFNRAANTASLITQGPGVAIN